MVWRIGGAGTLAAAVALGVGGASEASAKVKRFGHGMGMSQVGAQNRAAKGHDATEILNFYYPGTRPISVPEATVRVLFYERRAIWIRRSRAYPRGVTVRVRAGRIVFAGRPLPYAAVVIRGPVCLRKCYRGTLLLKLAGRRLRVINIVPMESYIRSVVPSEMPWFWSWSALRAQAVAARSHALHAVAHNRHRDFDVYQDTRSQAYWGIEQETTRTDAAVASTAGRVRVWRGNVIYALYTAANGGWTVPVEGRPYLRKRRDRFD